MSTDVGQGDSELAFLDVAPADGSTAATLTVNAPDGTSSLVAVTGGDLEVIPGASPVQYSQRWTADQPVVYSLAGRYVLRWAVTGTGEGAEDLEVFVVASPVAGGPAWAPGRSRPANYLPHRTLVRNLDSITEGQNQYEFTWDSTTIPTGLAVDRLIADGVAWVSSRVYPMNTRVQDAAGVVVALYAAAAVERGWPRDDSSLPRANDLEKRMDTLMADLIAANDKANTDDQVANPSAVLPVWSFPPADARYDSSCYW